VAALANRKSVMTLYSAPLCIYSHCARLVLHEKGIGADVISIDPSEPPEDIMELSPYGRAPVMVDRDLVLYDSRIIMEYLDERFPHPPLHRMDPVSRAQARMLVHRVDRDWYSLVDEIETGGEKKAARARRQLREALTASAPIFEAKPYFMSEEFSLVDCCLAPLLWRLSAMGIDLPKRAQAVRVYADRLFERKSFQASLTEEEKDLANPIKLMTA